jgi:hypothetical protein
VKLRGKFIKGKEEDLPTLIWLPEIVDHAHNFEQFLMREDNKVSQ